jgi:tetratricopeptide (TPR) repeat protein
MNRTEADALQAQCRRMLSQDAANVDAWEGLGRAEYALSQYVQARAAFEKATQLDPTRVHSWDGLGRADDALKQYARATQAFEQALALQPDASLAASIWEAKGFMLSRQGKEGEALRAFETALALDPSQRSYWSYRVGALARLRRFRDAWRALREEMQAYHEGVWHR